MRLDPADPLIVAWPDLEIPEQQTELLDILLENLGFLGRAESWVQAFRLQEWDPEQANCLLGNLEFDLNNQGEKEPVKLLSPQENNVYLKWREDILNDLNLPQVKPKRKRLQLQTTIPERLLDALRLETGDIRSAGWSRPPGSSEILYQRPRDAMSAVSFKPNFKKPEAIFYTCRFVLSGKTLPLMEDAVRIGELMRLAVMKRAKNILGEDHIPFELSGHALPGDTCHGHVFFLPEDKFGDGRIDHVVVRAPVGFREDSLLVLNDLTRIWWDKKGLEWYLLLEGAGERSNFSGVCNLCRTSRTWISVTPYLHAWYSKKKFTMQDQVRRECRERNLPEPEEMEVVNEISLGRGKKKGLSIFTVSDPNLAWCSRIPRAISYD